jgi:CPA1 family monovalent cation:H+ antiporter
MLVAFAPFIIVAFAAILIARVLSVYPILWFAQILGETIPNSWKRVLAFAGLRGAVSIALVLSLTETSFGETLEAMVFGVALLSLILQAEILRVYVNKKYTESPDTSAPQPLWRLNPNFGEVKQSL